MTPLASHLVAVGLALLFVGYLAFTAWRMRDSRSLDDWPATLPSDPQLVSVIIPARNEERNIERCLSSIVASTWPLLEVIVVDDSSTDATAQIARRVAQRASIASEAGVLVDPRRPMAPMHRHVKVVAAPPLPAGWFGKQWACHTGVQAARGTIVLFTDADTRHGPELLARAIAAMKDRKSSLLTVIGQQELGSFWEKVVQPTVFALLHSRFGGLEAIGRAKSPMNKIANGQFLLFPRDIYEQIGGHAAVRDHVAEDLRLAQKVTELGGQLHALFATEHFSTRMYTTLGEIRRGWGKNMYAAGRDTFPQGPLMGLFFRLTLPLSPLVPLIPIVAALLGWLDVLGSEAYVFAAITAPVNLGFWMAIYRFTGLHALWGFFYPLGSLVFAWICTEAAWRGMKVTWKDRTYDMEDGRQQTADGR
jgi:chlorobactene glucosyltransferase